MNMKRRRMYAVSADGIGLIAGTLAYSRRKAISFFVADCFGGTPENWGEAKRAGYRTVQALVEVTTRWDKHRTTKRK